MLLSASNFLGVQKNAISKYSVSGYFSGENNHLQGVPDELISNFIVLLKLLNISYHFLTFLKVKKR